MPEVEELFRALTGASPLIIAEFSGPPASKARPRFARGGRAYTPKESREAEERTSTHLRTVVQEPFLHNVAMVCIFYRPNKQRIDTDNMLKHVCDAANGILWKDDSQVTALVGVTEYDKKSPRTVIALGPHESSMPRGTVDPQSCEACGGLMKPVSRGAYARRSCSPGCRAVLYGKNFLDVPVACPECGTGFRRKHVEQIYCSAACRLSALHASTRSERPLSSCMDCGVSLAHRRGGRCRSCWRMSLIRPRKESA